MREIASLAELKSLIGQEVAVSDWVEISQQQVQLFADATGDHQWIHLDVERSRAESPYGGTIAHGFLTLSLLPMLMARSIHMTDVKMGVNYGLNKVRFPAPVRVGKRVRMRTTLVNAEQIGDAAVQITSQQTIEIEGEDKPACVAETLGRTYF